MTTAWYLLMGSAATVVLQAIAGKLLKLRLFFHPEEHIKTQGTRPTLGWRRVKSRMFRKKHLFEMAFDIVPDLGAQQVVVAVQWRFPRLDAAYFSCSLKERFGRAFIRNRRPYKDVGTQDEYSAQDKEHGIEIMRSYWQKSKKNGARGFAYRIRRCRDASVYPVSVSVFLCTIFTEKSLTAHPKKNMT